MVPSASARPSGRTRRHEGVSTRLLSYLIDELRGEYEKSLIHLPIGRPVLRMYVGSPLSEGVSGGDENARHHYVLRRTYNGRNSARARSLSEGGTRDHARVVLLQLHLAVRALLQRREGIVRMRIHLTGMHTMYLYSIYGKSAGR
jgi:hypothetical protein